MLPVLAQIPCNTGVKQLTSSGPRPRKHSTLPKPPRLNNLFHIPPGYSPRLFLGQEGRGEHLTETVSVAYRTHYTRFLVLLLLILGDCGVTV